MTLRKLVAAAIAAIMLTGAAPKPRPALGLLVPVGPPDYALILGALKGDRVETFGPYSFHVGEIEGVPVVVSIAPQDGPLVRSLAAQAMLFHYHIKAFLYPGTSGAHLGPDQMRIGDVVLGAANVDFGNFFMSKTGELVADEFGHEKASNAKFGALYLDPRLLAKLACSAQRVTAATALPEWLNPGFPRPKPNVFYYGVQGTSTMWLANREFMAKTDKVFHEIDEDGDWYSNLVATLHHVPFIEVSTISDSILEFPATDRGIPPAPAGEAVSVQAQRLSNRIMLDLIRTEGRAILAGKFDTPTADPYPAGVFDDPARRVTPPPGVACG